MNEKLNVFLDSKSHNKKDVKGWSRFRITVEPIWLIVPFMGQFTSGITIDLLQRNVCHQNFNLSYSECSQQLPSTIKADIEAMTADVNMFNNLIQAVCPLVLVLCVGPWSDINGRKPFLLWAIRGFTAYYFLWGLLSLFPKIPVLCFVIPAIPLSLTGGWVSVVVCCQSYTADAWDEQKRPFRISVNVFWGITACILGNALSAPVFNATGYYAYQVMYFSCSCLAVMAHLYVSFVLEETIIINKNEKRSKLLDVEHMLSILKVLVVKPIRGRYVTLLTMTILASELTSWIGEANLVYLIGKSEYNWTLADYNLFTAVTTVITAISPVSGMWLLKNKLNLHAFTIVAICSCNMLAFNLLKSFSTSETMFWITSCMTRVVVLIGPIMDSEFSLLVSERDLGKAYAFNALLDALSPIVSLPFFNQLYKMLLPDNTLKMYLLASSLSFVTTVSSLALLWHRLSTLRRNGHLSGDKIQIS